MLGLATLFVAVHARGEEPRALGSITFVPETPDLLLRVAVPEEAHYVEASFRDGTSARPWHFETVCEGPCAAAPMPVGTHAFAVAQTGGKSIPAGSVVVDGHVTVHATYSSRSWLRVIGVVIAVAGTAAGAFIAVDPRPNTTAGEGAVVATGLCVAGGSLALGYFLALSHDRARVFVAPLVSGRTEGLSIGGKF